MLTSYFISWSFFVTKKCQKIQKIDRNWWLMIILKFTKNQGFTLSLEDTAFEKPHGGGEGGGGGQIDPLLKEFYLEEFLFLINNSNNNT